MMATIVISIAIALCQNLFLTCKLKQHVKEQLIHSVPFHDATRYLKPICIKTQTCSSVQAVRTLLLMMTFCKGGKMEECIRKTSLPEGLACRICVSGEV